MDEDQKVMSCLPLHVHTFSQRENGLRASYQVSFQNKNRNMISEVYTRFCVIRSIGKHIRSPIQTSCFPARVYISRNGGTCPYMFRPG